MSNQGTKKIPISMFVVEAFDYCEYHLIILTCDQSRHMWRYFFVRKPTWVDFGDRLEYYPNSAEVFLVRNPKLRFRVFFDIFPDDIDVDKLINDLPYKEIYGDGAIFMDGGGLEND